MVHWVLGVLLCCLLCHSLTRFWHLVDIPVVGCIGFWGFFGASPWEHNAVLKVECPAQLSLRYHNAVLKVECPAHKMHCWPMELFPCVPVLFQGSGTY